MRAGCVHLSALQGSTYLGDHMSDVMRREMKQLVQAAVFARAHASGLGFGFSQFAVFSVYALAFWYGGQLIRNGEMTFSEVLKVCNKA